MQLKEACLVVHRIHTNVHAGLLAQRVHEGLADAPNTASSVPRAKVTSASGQSSALAADAARDSAWSDQHNTGGQHRGGAQAGASQTA